jgi:predicted small secreted protein
MKPGVVKKTLLVLCVLCVPVLCLSACNTAEGFGRDLEGAGRSIQDTF